MRKNWNESGWGKWRSVAPSVYEIQHKDYYVVGTLRMNTRKVGMRLVMDEERNVGGGLSLRCVL